MLPTFLEGSCQALHLESILKDLSLCRFDIDLSHSGADLAQVFERHPFLPGAILVNQNVLIGIISRQQFLEFLIRPQGIELFLKQPLWVLHSYARREFAIFSGDTPILVAAQQALRRSPDLLGEPIVVQINEAYYLLDSQELNIAHWQIRGIETQVRYERTQAQMIQSYKMANLGRLVDGVAHEILDPVSFIWGNLSHIGSYSRDLLQLLALYEKVLPAPPPELLKLREQLDLDYLLEDLPKAIDSVKAGAERLSKLAASLQNFCHIDEVYPKPTDLHELLDSILLLLKSRLSSDIQVVKVYGQLPPVVCFPGQLNQVFINILTNCLDRLLNQAVSQQLDLDFKARLNQPESITTEVKPTLEITTQVCSLPVEGQTATRWVVIRIADNGPSLSKEAQEQLLESFSVKRRSEKETSMAVSYQIVTAKHGGQFRVRSRADSHEKRTCEAFRGNAMQLDDLLPGIEFELLLPLA